MCYTTLYIEIMYLYFYNELDRVMGESANINEIDS